MSGLTRRQILGLGLGVVGLGAPASMVAWRLTGGSSRARFVEAVRVIVETPADAIVRETARLLNEGVSANTLLSAAFHAPILTGGDRGDVHAMMVVRAIHSLRLTLTGDEALIPVFWAVANANTWTRQDVMQPLKTEPAAGLSIEQGRADFLSALDERDVDKAETALVGLYRVGGRKTTRYTVATAGCGSFTDVHRMIYAIEAHAALSFLGQNHGEQVLRSVAHHLALSATPLDQNEDALINAEFLSSSVKDRGFLKPDIGATQSLLSAIRDPGSDPIGPLVADILESRVSTDSVWDALSLAAIECAIDDPSASGMGVHSVTLTAALQSGCRGSGDFEDKRWIMLQGASWLSHLYKGTARLDAETPMDPPSSVEDVFGGDDLLEAWRRGLAWASAPDRSKLFRGAVLGRVAVGGTDTHDFKYTAAAKFLASNASRHYKPHVLAALAIARPLRRGAEPWDRLEEVRALKSGLAV